MAKFVLREMLRVLVERWGADKVLSERDSLLGLESDSQSRSVGVRVSESEPALAFMTTVEGASTIRAWWCRAVRDLGWVDA